MKSKSILLSILATAALTACHNDENISAGTDHGAASFTASINSPQVTRAYDTFWEADDQIGITGKSGEKQYTNVAYETSGNGNFTVVPPSTEIYYQDDAEVTFTAYYPYTENGSLAEGTKIIADTKLQKNQKKFDFLYATATGSKANPTSPVSFKFAHRMAKVALTIHKGSGVEFDEVKAVALALQGFKNNGSFDITSGEATATGDALTSPWTFAGNAEETNNAPFSTNNDGETVTYTLILFPQTFEAVLPFSATLTDRQTFTAGIDFTTANTDAGDENPGNYLTAGRQYNLSVTLHKTAITVDGCSIEQWENADGGNIDAN